MAPCRPRKRSLTWPRTRPCSQETARRNPGAPGHGKRGAEQNICRPRTPRPSGRRECRHGPAFGLGRRRRPSSQAPEHDSRSRPGSRDGRPRAALQASFEKASADEERRSRASREQASRTTRRARHRSRGGGTARSQRSPVEPAPSGADAGCRLPRQRMPRPSGPGSREGVDPPSASRPRTAGGRRVGPTWRSLLGGDPRKVTGRRQRPRAPVKARRGR